MAKSVNRGQTLVEVIVAVGVISLVLVGLVSAITFSLANTQYARNKALATNYSQQAIEWYRSERDTSGWAEFYKKAPQAPAGTCQKNNYCQNQSIFSWSVPGNCTGVIDDNYNIFKRNTYLQTESPDRIKVVVTTGWTQGSRPSSVVLSTYLTNYRGSSAVAPVNCDFPATPPPVPTPVPSPSPDLTMGTIFTQYWNFQYRVWVNVANYSSVDAPPVQLRATIDGSPYQITTESNPAGTQHNELVASFAVEPCLVNAVIDPDNVLAETDEANNSGSQAFNCPPSPVPTPVPTPAPSESPDVYPKSINVFPYGGGQGVFVEVFNNSPFAVSGVEVRAWIDNIQRADISTPVINPGQSSIELVAIQSTIPCYISVLVDATDELTESDEANNTSGQGFACTFTCPGGTDPLTINACYDDGVSMFFDLTGNTRSIQKAYLLIQDIDGKTAAGGDVDVLTKTGVCLGGTVSNRFPVTVSNTSFAYVDFAPQVSPYANQTIVFYRDFASEYGQDRTLHLCLGP